MRIDYPNFSQQKPVAKFEDYAKTNKKFSGFIAYEKTFNRPDTDGKIYLNITDAGEDVEVFINGKSNRC